MLYLKFISMALKEKITYRINIFFSSIGLILQLMIKAALWNAIYQNQQTISLKNFDISKDEMIVYVLVSTVVSLLMGNNVVYEIQYKIKTGIISFDLIRPLYFRLYMLSVNIGRILVNVIFNIIPFCIFCIFFFNIPLPQHYMPHFLVSVIFAYLINFQISYIIGILTFWLIQTWPLEMIVSSLIKVFSGLWVPIWFFPDIIYKLSLFLPFRLIYAVPMSYYLEKIEDTNPIFPLLYQVLWLAILFIVSELVWLQSRKKLIIQGG